MLQTHFIDMDKIKHEGARIRAFGEALESWGWSTGASLGTSEPAVVYEVLEFQQGRGGDFIKMQTGLLLWWLEKVVKLPYIGLGVPKLKMWATSRGDAKKEEMRHSLFLTGRFPKKWSQINEHEVDATWLALWGHVNFVPHIEG
jgi:hypothetical protein